MGVLTLKFLFRNVLLTMDTLLSEVEKSIKGGNEEKALDLLSEARHTLQQESRQL